jgi:hypothetical protein
LATHQGMTTSDTATHPTIIMMFTGTIA